MLSWLSPNKFLTEFHCEFIMDNETYKVDAIRLKSELEKKLWPILRQFEPSLKQKIIDGCILTGGALASIFLG